MNFPSWNVWGLTDISRKYYVHDTKYQLAILDVLCLQEVKVVGFLLTSTCHVIWMDSVMFCSQHEDG